MNTHSKVKKAQASKAPVKARKVSDVERLVDAIVMEDPAIKAAVGPAKRQKAARAELLELVTPGHKADDEIVVRGTLGTVKFTAAASGLTVKDMRKVQELLGDDLFYELASVSMENLRANLTVGQLKAVTRPCSLPRKMSVLTMADLGVLPGQDVVE